MPDETKGERRTDIKLHMTESTAHDLFRITPYHRYLKDAIFLFSSGYTGRIYLLINANKQMGTWTVEYEKLRKILLTTFDKEKKRYVCDKYADISDFKKRVLEPARKEIAEAANHIDCTFDYEFRYPAGKKRGKPEAIIFHISLTDTGRNMKQQDAEAREAIVQRAAGAESVRRTECKHERAKASQPLPSYQGEGTGTGPVSSPAEPAAPLMLNWSNG